MSLVVVRLIGGLGNQMFQYAAGRAIAVRCGANLKLDLSGFETYARRRYELDTLPIAAMAATAAELADFGIGPIRRRSVLDRVWGRLGVARKSTAPAVHREPHFHFDPTVPSLVPPVYLDGYWQSEKYFTDCAETIRRDFTPTLPLDPENAAVAVQIDAINAVSLHVRRGDYVNDQATGNYHGTCSIDYYRRALAHIGARVEAPHLFVFSDDQEWACNNIRLGVPTTVVKINPSDRGYRDMQLMARCRHHIIANSSFSWWGAWLNSSHDKIVVAPRRWFNTSANDTRDLVPKSWIRL